MRCGVGAVVEKAVGNVSAKLTWLGVGTLESWLEKVPDVRQYRMVVPSARECSHRFGHVIVIRLKLTTRDSDNLMNLLKIHYHYSL
jgi:hypothetical protein